MAIICSAQTESLRIKKMEVPHIKRQNTIKKIPMVLDTDTYNEVDDQFAIAYALRSPELDVQAIYAAPYYNTRSTSPAHGMELSYDEIMNLLGLLGRNDLQTDSYVKRGSTRYLGDEHQAERSDAVEDLIEKAMKASSEEPLYVVAIGAITNIANAIMLEPKILDKIVVVWLGGHALNYGHNLEFNLMQDTRSARIILDSKVPLVLLPCGGVVSSLATTIHELKACIGKTSDLSEYLVKIVEDYHSSHYAWSKVIWDVATIAWLKGIGCESQLIPCPQLNHDLDWKMDCWKQIFDPKVTEYDFPIPAWGFNPKRHMIQYVYQIDRDKIFYDLFKLLQKNEA